MIRTGQTTFGPAPYDWQYLLYHFLVVFDKAEPCELETLTHGS